MKYSAKSKKPFGTEDIPDLKDELNGDDEEDDDE